MFLLKKTLPTLYEPFRIFWIKKQLRRCVAYIWKILIWKVSAEMIPVYPHLNVMSFTFLFIYKTFFAWVVFDDIPYLAKLCKRQVTTRCGKNFTQFCFCFILELSFYVQSKKFRIYADLLRFQSRVMDPIYIVILMRSIIPFFIHPSHVLALV